MSYSSGEAAEQVVRMTLNGVEVAAKISGKAAERLAVLLYAVLKDQKKTLFTDCRVTAGSLPVAAGYFGRPWGASADVAFVNTQLQYAGIITGAGWTSMSGNQPENAKFKEYGTTCNGAPVNTGSRVRGTVQYSANGLDTASYLGAWVPYYLNGGTLPEIEPVSGTLVKDLKPMTICISGKLWRICRRMQSFIPTETMPTACCRSSLHAVSRL